MNKNLKNDFLQFQFDFFTQQNYQFYYLLKKNHKQYYSDDVLKGPLNDSQLMSHLENGFVLQQRYQKEDIQHIHPYTDRVYYYHLNTDLNEHKMDKNTECFIAFIDKNKNKPKTIIDIFNNFNNLNSCGFMNNIELIFNQLMDLKIFDKKDTVTYLSNINRTLWTLAGNEKGREKVEYMLNNLNFSHEDTLFFWTQHLKARHIDLNKPSIAAFYLPFLEKKFNSQELENFQPFFNALKAKKEDVKADFFENNDLLFNSTLINIKKVISTYCINNWNESYYVNSLIDLKKPLMKYYKIKECELSYINKAKKHFRVSVIHNNPQFTKELLQDILIDYFSWKKSHVSINEETIIYAFLEKRDLESVIKEKDDSSNLRKLKI